MLVTFNNVQLTFDSIKFNVNKCISKIFYERE